MNTSFHKNLHDQGLISDESFEKISEKQSAKLFSVHWELKTLLYLGVMLLSTGFGIIIYKNLDNLSHQVILLSIAAVSIACFLYCFKKKLPYSPEKVSSPNSFFDYILLLGTLSFLTFLGYLQFQYTFFGTNYGLATFIPMLILFFIAYYFDHIGILTMAIANLAVWMGISVTPKQLLLNTDFNSQTIIYTYLVLGAFLLAAAYFSERYQVKKHFAFSYRHYGIHITFVTLLGAYFDHYDNWSSLIWLIILGAVAVYTYYLSFKSNSFYFLLLTVLYSYIAVSGLFVRISVLSGDFPWILLYFYFIGSAIGFIYILKQLNKRFKTG